MKQIEIRIDVLLLIIAAILGCGMISTGLTVGGGGSSGGGFADNRGAAPTVLGQEDACSNAVHDDGVGAHDQRRERAVDTDAAIALRVAELEKESPDEAAIAEALSGVASLSAVQRSTGGADARSSAYSTPAQSKSTAAAWNLRQKLSALIQKLYDDTTAFADHDNYIIIRRMFQNSLLQARRKFVVKSADSQSSSQLAAAAAEEQYALRQRTIKCFEFVRDDQKPSDSTFHAPCVPWDADRLKSVALGRLGVIAEFKHISEPTAEAIDRHTPADMPTVGIRKSVSPLRVGVTMSGHMRTYARTADSIISNLLQPNQALLFLMTYPDLGEKAVGEQRGYEYQLLPTRDTERDEKLSIVDVARRFAGHLAALYLADMPTVTRAMMAEFPTLLVTSHRWIVYQLLATHLAHKLLLGHGKGWSDGSYPPIPVAGEKGGGAGQPSGPWSSFDFVVRARPDAFVLGPLVLRFSSDIGAVAGFKCNGKAFVQAFETHQLLRSAHHPRKRLPVDPLSEAFTIGSLGDMTILASLYKEIRTQVPNMQERLFFPSGTTHEKLWGNFIAKSQLRWIEVPAWNAVVRNSATASFEVLNRTEPFVEPDTNALATMCPALLK